MIESSDNCCKLYHPVIQNVYFSQAFEVFDDGYGYVDVEEIKELLSSVDEALTLSEQKEILAKAGDINNGKMNYERMYDS